MRIDGPAHRACTLLIASLAIAASSAFGEMSEIKVAQQYGISYLPLMIMEEQKLIEKQAKVLGVDVSVGWAKFAGGNVMNDALLSNSLQFASGGVAPMITSVAHARQPRRQGGRGDQLDADYLNSRNPSQTIQISPRRTRSPCPRQVSIQALTLQMAADMFGDGQYGVWIR
jgi:NitT/TauT family transport system substrate-binding protein